MGRNKRPSRAHISALWFKRQIKFPFDGLLFGLYLSNNSSKLFHGLIIWQACSFALELLQKVLAGHGLSCEVPSHGFFSDSLRAFLTTGRCWGACSWASSCPFRGRCRGNTSFFCLLDFPLHLGYLFYLHLLGASLILLQKPRQFKKLFQHGEHETDREQMEQHPKC